MMKDFEKVIHFWFQEISPDKWWKKDPIFDDDVRRRFLDLHRQARQCELDWWRTHAEGALAEIIILDQFSRNIFRGQPDSFTFDPLALCLAQAAIKNGLDRHLLPSKKLFMYLPFMHSESPKIHLRAVTLFEQQDCAEYLDYELKHRMIIDRFGRYPHRNAILGRVSTPEEVRFLQKDGSSF